jgi:hypothetical protein
MLAEDGMPAEMQAGLRERQFARILPETSGFPGFPAANGQTRALISILPRLFREQMLHFSLLLLMNRYGRRHGF